MYFGNRRRIGAVDSGASAMCPTVGLVVCKKSPQCVYSSIFLWKCADFNTHVFVFFYVKQKSGPPVGKHVLRRLALAKIRRLLAVAKREIRNCRAILIGSNPQNYAKCTICLKL